MFEVEAARVLRREIDVDPQRRGDLAEEGGVTFRKTKDSLDVGTWRIAEDGAFCRTWNVTDGGRARCFDVYRTGETFELQTRDRWTTSVLERRAGNPERF